MKLSTRIRIALVVTVAVLSMTVGNAWASDVVAKPRLSSDGNTLAIDFYFYEGGALQKPLADYADGKPKGNVTTNPDGYITTFQLWGKYQGAKVKIEGTYYETDDVEFYSDRVRATFEAPFSPSISDGDSLTEASLERDNSATYQALTGSDLDSVDDAFDATDSGNGQAPGTVINYIDMNNGTLKLRGASVQIEQLAGTDSTLPVTPSNPNVEKVTAGNLAGSGDVLGITSLVKEIGNSGEYLADEDVITEKLVGIVPLPVVKATVTRDHTGILTFKTKLNAIAGSKVTNVILYKLTPHGTTKFTKIARINDIADGQFALTDSSGISIPDSAIIKTDTDYYVSLAVKDGGDYDCDGAADGSILDPAEVGATPSSPSSNSSGSGGCSTGAFGLIGLGLSLMGLIVASRGKKRG